MKYPFSRPAFDLRAWSDVNRALEETCSQILAGDFSASDLKDFCRRAVSDALPLPEDPSSVFWGFDSPDSMPGDARCDFFYLPSYLMIQCLLASVLRSPNLMLLPGVRDVLHRGLSGCASRSLSGYGYDAMSGLLRNLAAFLEAGYLRFALLYPDVAPDFRKMFFAQVAKVREDYHAGNHVFDMGDNLKAEQERVLSQVPDHLPGDLSCNPDESLYLAYGSNMDEAQMRRRCPGSVLVATGFLHGYRLEFFLHATVTQTNDPADIVPVAIWRISSADEAALDRYEGVPTYYSRHQATVHLKSGEKVEGLIYLMEMRRPAPVREEYFDGILRAYEQLGFCDWISKTLMPAKFKPHHLPQFIPINSDPMVFPPYPTVGEDGNGHAQLFDKSGNEHDRDECNEAGEPSHRVNVDDSMSFCLNEVDQNDLGEAEGHESDRAIAAAVVRPEVQRSRFGHPINPQKATGNKLAAFSFRGRLFPVHSWRHFLVTLTTMLYEEDPSILETLVLSDPVQGERNVKLSLSEEGMRKPVPISNDGIFLETNKSAEDICKWALVLLREYRIPKSSVHLFYRGEQVPPKISD